MPGELIDIWNSAVGNKDFETDMVDDARIIRDRLNKITDGNVFAVIRGNSRYGKPLEKVTQDMMLAVEVTPETAKQLRDAQRNMGERYNLWDELKRRHYVGPGARDNVSASKISQADYEAARAASKNDKGFDRSKPASEMSQREYERWRKSGGGRGK